MIERKEIKKVLKTINSGQWLQLEGSVGRYCNDFMESKIIIRDEKANKEKGSICFRDGYGRFHQQSWFKIDWDQFQKIQDQELFN